MNKIVLSIITLGLVVGIGFIFWGGSKNNRNNSETITIQPEPSMVIREGVQYITIKAKGGYSPRTSYAQAGVPTKLIIKTNSTYDCSAALVIRSLGYQKILPQTGEEIIDLGTPKVGTSLQGTCSMGMYNFSINFN